ncbi:MAG: 2-oxoacid:ferredoxin oxidoreductase subunit beta [bacterium]|nr:2-oxoacid:ferredoxin oxidoreductase subunit beta [Acidimicrobiia bacterium]MCY4649742.1 2-oxoacid:ferredoxin oxidoreductase subunit beta [bacterium]
MSNVTYKRTDLQSDQEVRWCPGCGDYTILASVQTFMAQMGVRRENIVVVSGIGCAARLPYYMKTYGFHTIHGRAPAIATGLAASRPDLSVWVVTGDGDALSIGGNHLIHALRRNANIKILLFNNQIYGLTKGQYSPTSEVGKRTKSTPFGSIDYPFNPVSLALGAEATFVARTIDMDRNHTQQILAEAVNHRGSVFIEIYQNCNVFNDKAFIQLTGKTERVTNRINLQDGKPVVFGRSGENCVVMEDGEARIKPTASVSKDQILVHDPTRDNPSVAFSISRLAHGPFGPTPLGVFRKVRRPTYGAEMQLQIVESQDRGPGDLDALFSSIGTWTVT